MSFPSNQTDVREKLVTTPSFLTEHGTEHEGAREADYKNEDSDQNKHRE